MLIFVRIIILVVFVLMVYGIIQDVIRGFRRKYNGEKGFLNNIKSFLGDAWRYIVTLSSILVIVFAFTLLAMEVFFIENELSRNYWISGRVPYLTYIVLPLWPFVISLLQWGAVESAINKAQKKVFPKDNIDIFLKTITTEFNQKFPQSNLSDILYEKIFNKSNVYIGILGFVVALIFHLSNSFGIGITYMMGVPILNSFLEDIFNN